MRQDFFADNNGTQIHYAVLHQNEQQIPWLMIPGMGCSADEVISDLGNSFPDYQVHLNLRGRGKSDSPDIGYTLNDQVSDIEAVVKHLGLTKFFLYGHSVGSSIAIRYTHLFPQAVAALVVGDFPPFYPPHDEKWLNQLLSQLEQIDMSEKALRGIANSGEDYIELSPELAQVKCPLLLIRGGQGDAYFRAEHEPYIRNIVPTIQIAVLEASGHELMMPNPNALVSVLQNFATTIVA